MKEVLKLQDMVRLTPFRNLLEAEGIPTFIRNEHLGSVEPIPIFAPALCVVEDGDYPRAKEILDRNFRETAAASTIEQGCPACGEMNPGNFDLCWNCGAEFA